MKHKKTLLPWLQEKHLCLASASPRRLALLRQVGLDPDVQPAHIDETQNPEESVEQYVERMAVSKARLCPAQKADLVIAADTVVVLDNESLGKPGNAEEARRMLARLSHRQHRVLTAVALYQPVSQSGLCRVVETLVWIKPLSAEEIFAYVATGEPLDKAGSYGIQGVGGFMVARIDGSYSGVVGLPLYETLAMLREFA